MKTIINITRRALVQAISVASVMGLFPTMVTAQSIPKEIKLDWAYYSPPSMVIRKFGWMEDEFKPDGTSIKWVFSQGSNNSLEFINSGSTDFASTSGI